MAKDDFEFEDLDFEDLNFDIPDIDAVEPKDDRKPVARAARDFAKGTARGIISTDGLEDVIRRGLPEGYSLALNTKNAVADTFSDVYRASAKDLEPAVRAVKGALGRVAKKTEGKVPSWFQKRIDAFSEMPESYKPSPAADQMDFSAQLGEIFKARADLDNETRSEDRADQLLRDKIDASRYNNQQEVFGIIARGIDRMVSYQDEVEINYERKSLELQFKHLALLQQIGTKLEADNATAISELRNVVKNTGLPEANKIRISELGKRMLNERLTGKALNTVGNFSANYFGELRNNLRGAASGLLQGGGGDLQMVRDAMDGMSPAERRQFMATGAGQALGGFLRGEIAMRASPYLERFSPISRLGNKLKSRFSDLPGQLNDYATSATTREGFAGTFEQFIKDMLPKYFQDETLGQDMLMSSDMASYYDEQSRRSLTEIIPGLLTSINRWTQVMATGVDVGDADTQVYNQVRGGFTSKASMVADVSERILPRHTRRAVQDNLNTIIASLGAEEYLTQAAFAALRRQFLVDSSRGAKFNAKRLANPDTYESVEDESVRVELAEFFRNKFNLDDAGNVREGMQDSFNILSGKLTDQQLALKNTMPAPDEAIRALSRVVGRDTIRAMGFIRREGLTDKIDTANLYDRLLESPDIQRELLKGAGGDANKFTLPTPDASVTPSSSIADHVPSIRHGDLADGGLFSEYWGEDSLVIGELRAIRGEQGQQAISIIEAINSLEIVTAGGDPSATGGRSGSKILGAAKWAKDKTLWAASKYLKGWGALYKGAFSMGMGALSRAGDALGFVTGSISDVYVKGESEPRLLARKFREEAYFDAGTMEPIKSPKDIKGPVLDINGDFVLTAEDIAKGLVSRGKRLSSSVFDTVGKLAKGYGSLAIMPYKLAMSLGKAGFDFVNDQRKKVRDMYLNGEDAPRILGRLLEKGDYYWSVASGKFVSTISEVIGEIRAGGPDGDIVVTDDDVRRSSGWVDSTGRKLATKASNVLGFAGKAIRGYMRAVFSAYRFIGRGIKTFWKGLTGKGPDISLSGDFQSDMVKIGYAQLSVQERILGLLQESMGKPKSSMFDRDGDGLIDGSWQAKKKKEDEESKDGKLADAVADLRKNGLSWGALGGGVGGLFEKAKGVFGKKGKGGEDEESGLDAGDGFFSSRKGRALLSMGGKAALAGAGLFATAALENKVSGRDALDFTGFKDTFTNMNPVNRLFGKSMTQGFGFGAKWGERLFNAGNKAPIHTYRMAQYGVSYTDKPSVERIIAMERYLLQFVTTSEDGTAKIAADRIAAKHLLERAGVPLDGSKEAQQERFTKFVLWFNKRFLPVYTRAMGAQANLKTMAKFHELDEKLPADQALEYLRATHIPELSDVYNELVDPSNTIKLSEDADDVESYYNDAIDHYETARKQDPNAAQETQTATTAKTAAGAAAASAAAGTSKESASEAARKETGLVDKLKTALSFAPPVAMFNGVTSAWKAVGDWFNDADDKEAKEKETRYRYNADSGWNDPAQLVRFFAYGMPDRVPYLRDSLIKLESHVAAYLSYQGESAVLELIPAQVLERIGYAFAPNGMQADDKASWLYWYEKRFVPVLLLYASEVRRRKAIDPIEAGAKLPPAELEGVLESLLSAKDSAGYSLWKYEESPWPGVLVGTDPTIANDAMAMLKSSVTRYEAEKGTRATNAAPRVLAPRASGGLSRWAPVVAPRAGELPTGGTFVKHPGQGRSGDVNAIPHASGQGWDSVKGTIVAAAEMTGVDPALAATMAGIESTFNPNARNSKSSATGLYQITDSTFRELIGKHGAKYGIASNATAADPRVNSLMAMEYLKENHQGLQDAFPGRKISDVDMYLTHFLGPSGARRFLAADAGDQAAMHVSEDAVRANPQIFRPGATVGDVYAHFDQKLQKMRQAHTATASSTSMGLVGKPSFSAAAPSSTITGSNMPLMMKLPPSAGTGSTDANLRDEFRGEATDPEGVKDGSGASQYLVNNGVDLANMNPAFLKNFYGMVEEYGLATGKTVKINSAARSQEEQARLRRIYGAGAAAPGKSLHEFGLAMDIDRATLNEMERLGLMKKYGFTRPVGQEPWHMEPSGIQGDLDGFKQDPMAAANAIMAGLGKGGGGYGTQQGAAKYRRNPEVAAAAIGADASGFRVAPAAPMSIATPPFAGDQRPAQSRTPAYVPPSVERALEAARAAEIQSQGSNPTLDMKPTNDILGRQLEVQTGIYGKVEEVRAAISALSDNVLSAMADNVKKDSTVSPVPTEPKGTPVTSRAKPVVGARRPASA